MWICSIVFYPHVYCPLLTVKSILFVILYDIQMFDDGMQEILLPDKEVEKEGENIMEANSGHLMIEEKNRTNPHNCVVNDFKICSITLPSGGGFRQ